MDLATVGHNLKTSVHRMHLLSPDELPLYAYEDPKKGWQVTTDKEGKEREGVELRPSVILLVGKDSAAFRQREVEMKRRAMDALMNNRRAGGRGYDPTKDEQERLQTISAATVGWENIVWNDDPKGGGKTYLMDYSPENAITLYEGYPPGADQADREIVNRANFTESA